MAAPQFVSSASRDLKPFCPLFRAEGEVTVASVLRTQLQGPGTPKEQSKILSHPSCPLHPAAPASGPSPKGSKQPPASQGPQGEEHLAKETPACAHQGPV